MTDAAGGPAAAQGGLAPLALRAHPPGYFRQDEGGAVPAAPLVLRGVLLLAGLWLAVRLLPGLPDGVAAAVVAGLGGLIALPWAWASAVDRGHGLRVLTGTGRLRALLGGPMVRLAVAGLAGAVAAAALLLRLTEGGSGAGVWLVAGLVLPLTWALMAGLAPRIRAEVAGLHARRLVHLWARLAAVGLALAGAGVLALWWPPQPAPLDLPAGTAPLVAEALALARLWSGLEAYALGQAAEFGTWGRGLALAVALGAQAAVFWALASLAVALALPGREWGRALGPASDALPVPLVGRTGPVVAGLLALALVGAAMAAGRWLGAQPVETRPAARIAVTAEQVRGALYAVGTRQALDALRAPALAADAEARARLPELLNAGFDAMAAHVDPFLDAHYSLLAEYLRLAHAVTGNLEARVTAQLNDSLLAGDPFAPSERLVADAEARARDLAQAEAALLAARRIEGVNPARLRLIAPEGAAPALPDMLGPALRRAQGRWAVAVGTGAIAGAVAARIVQRLAARGLGATALRVVTRVGGPLVALGVDYGLLRLDEYRNRDAFRAEILAEIEAQRSVALGALAALAGGD